MDKHASESAGHSTAAFALPSNSTGRLSHSPFNRCERISRAQGTALRPGDQIAAPRRPATASVPFIAADLVGKPSGGSSIPLREEDQ